MYQNYFSITIIQTQDHLVSLPCTLEEMRLASSAKSHLLHCEKMRTQSIKAALGLLDEMKCRQKVKKTSVMQITIQESIFSYTRIYLRTCTQNPLCLLIDAMFQDEEINTDICHPFYSTLLKTGDSTRALLTASRYRPTLFLCWLVLPWPSIPPLLREHHARWGLFQGFTQPTSGSFCWKCTKCSVPEPLSEPSGLFSWTHL